MRDYSKVSPTVWRSKKFRSLPDVLSRHVYLYLLTCPHANSAGCFDLHPMYACADLGITEKQYGDCLANLVTVGLVAWDDAENTVLIENWIEYNAPANPKHAMGMLAQLDQAASAALKFDAFQSLNARIKASKFDRDAAVRNAIQSFFEQFTDRIPTETETETRPKQDETETKPDQTETFACVRETPPAAAPPDGGGLAALSEPTAAILTAAADRTPTPTRLLSTAYMQHPVRQDDDLTIPPGLVAKNQPHRRRA